MKDTAEYRHSPFEALIAEGRERSRRTGEPTYVAMVESVPAGDPLDALEAFRLAAADDPALAAVSGPERMYWSEPGTRRSLVAFGAAATFTANGAGRFAEIQRAWTELRASLVQDPTPRARGVGPLLIGGASFRDDADGRGWWRGFPAALFVLPRLLLTVAGDEAWLTTTVCVDADDDCDVTPETLHLLRARIVEHRDTGAFGGTGEEEALSFTDARPAAEWRALVGDAVEEIRAGEMTKVVLARAVDATANRPMDPMLALRQLRAAHPGCYVFGCWRGDRAFVGATPERLVRVEGDRVRASSLAGSIRRGSTATEDRALVERLRTSAKDRAEEAIVRRALEEMLGELCDHVVAAEQPEVITLTHVHHLHTPVVGRLRDGRTVLDLVAQLHPTPAVGGAPRDAALRFIHEREELDRGWYASPIGWVDEGGGEFAVALRSALIAGCRARLFAGCGVMATSSPDGEHGESLLKLAPMQKALAAALAGDTKDSTTSRPHAAAAGERGC